MTRPLRRGGGSPTMRVWTDSIEGPSPCRECGRPVSKAVLAKRNSPMTFDGDLADAPLSEVQTATKRTVSLVDIVEHPTHYNSCPGPDVERTK